MSPEEIARIKWRFMDMASECTDGKFRVDVSNREIVSSLFDYFMGIPGKLDTGKGLWIEGPVGTGKSTLMFVFSKFMQRMNKGFKVYICSQVTSEYSMTGDIDKYLLNEDGYCKGPVPMCFDELGREPNPAKYYGTELNVMQHILHIRYSLWQQGGLKTFVTTNFNAKEIGDLYGDFIRDRRREMFNILVMNGESRRGTK